MLVGPTNIRTCLSFQSSAPSTQTQTQTIFFFLSVYLKPRLSLSVSGGPQHYKATQSALLTSDSWSPMTMVSLGWQGERTTLGVGYSRIVTGGGGLSGAYHSNSASASAAWQVSRAWNVGISGSYGNYQTLTPLFIQSSPGGHTLSGTASAQRSLSEHLERAARIQLDTPELRWDSGAIYKPGYQVAHLYPLTISSPDHYKDSYAANRSTSSAGRIQCPALPGHSSSPAHALLDPDVYRMARRLGSKLGLAGALQVGHADFGGAAHHAEGPGRLEPKREFARAAAKHHAADSQPFPPSADCR